MNMRDGGSLCIGRGILDLNTIKIVGYCVAGNRYFLSGELFLSRTVRHRIRDLRYIKTGSFLYGNIEQEESYQGFVKENLKKNRTKRNYQSRKIKAQ